MQSRCINNLAMRAFLEGQWPLAQDRFAMAAELLHRVGDTANEAVALYNQAEMAIRQGRFDFAEMQLERADRSARIADDVELLALILRETGKVRVGQGRVAEARSAFAEARAGLATEGLDHEVVEIESGLAECLAIEGDLDGAEASLVAASRDRRGMGHGRCSRRCTATSERSGCGRDGRGGRRGVRGRAGRPRRRRRRVRRARSTCSAWPGPAARRPVARAQRPGPPWRRSASSCCPTGSTPSSR